MTVSISRPASTDHVRPYPPVPSAPCCGQPVTDKEPVPPGWMLLDGEPLDGLAGMVIVEREVMDPTLRGVEVDNRQLQSPALRGTRSPWGPRPGPRFTRARPFAPAALAGLRTGSKGLGCGCTGSADARRTAMSGLGAFTPSLLDEVTASVRSWVVDAGISISLPPTPTDVIYAVYRLAETERDLEVLRQKLRAMRAAGVLRSGDVAAYTNAANAYYSAAKAIYTPVVDMIRTASPTAAAIIPALTPPPGIDAPDRPIPWVPTEGDLARLHVGDITGGSTDFRDAVNAVRARLGGGAAVHGLRGLGLFGIDDLTIGTLLLIVIGIVAVAAIAVALAVPAYALTQALVAWIACRSATDVATRRTDAYNACVARGESTAACTRAATELVPPPTYPPAPGLAIGGGAVLALAALAGGAWWLFGTEGGRKARASFAGVKPRRRGRSLRW